MHFLSLFGASFSLVSLTVGLLIGAYLAGGVLLGDREQPCVQASRLDGSTATVRRCTSAISASDGRRFATDQRCFAAAAAAGSQLSIAADPSNRVGFQLSLHALGA